MNIKRPYGILFATLGLALTLRAVAAAEPVAAQTQRVELRIDVTGSVQLPGKIEIAATAFLPDARKLSERPVAIFALPGGGLTRHYFDVHIAGHEGYSEAEHHVARGLIVIAIDHLGVGDSSTTALDTMHIEDIAAANDAAVREISQRLVNGTLTPGYAALPNLFRIGIGQSMGGGVTIIMQGRHRSYDAIAPLGFSAIHTVLPQRTEVERKRVMEVQSSKGGRWADVKSLSFADAKKVKVDHTYVSFWDDVPQDIIDAKMKPGYPPGAGAPNWLSKTAPNCVVAMLSPGYVAGEAAEVRVPVLVGLGERDVIPNPLAEPAAYQRTRDITVFVVRHLGHTHNLGTSRQVLWNRVADWSRIVSRVQ